MVWSYEKYEGLQPDTMLSLHGQDNFRRWNDLYFRKNLPEALPFSGRFFQEYSQTEGEVEGYRYRQAGYVPGDKTGKMVQSDAEIFQYLSDGNRYNS